MLFIRFLLSYNAFFDFTVFFSSYIAMWLTKLTIVFFFFRSVTRPTQSMKINVLRDTAQNNCENSTTDRKCNSTIISNNVRFSFYRVIRKSLKIFRFVFAF